MYGYSYQPLESYILLPHTRPRVYHPPPSPSPRIRRDAHFTITDLNPHRTRGRLRRLQVLDLHRGATTQPANPKRARASSKAAPEPEQQPDDDPMPHLPQFQPRNRHGEPIPLYRFRDMTRLQKLATYGDPYDTAAWTAATEEEDAAIAEQQALDAADKPTT